jgi:hypothetical protein
MRLSWRQSVFLKKQFVHNARIHRAERKEATRMSEQVIYAFLTGFGIGVSSYLSFVIGTAIASYFARKDLRGNENERDE